MLDRGIRKRHAIQQYANQISLHSRLAANGSPGIVPGHCRILAERTKRSCRLDHTWSERTGISSHQETTTGVMDAAGWLFQIPSGAFGAPFGTAEDRTVFVTWRLVMLPLNDGDSKFADMVERGH